MILLTSANDFQEPNEPTGSAVMGRLNYPRSWIFFLGDDMNSIEIQPQPFINNLVKLMGDCIALDWSNQWVRGSEKRRHPWVQAKGLESI